jgi:putative flavoprotein involved in K+ transport
MRTTVVVVGAGQAGLAMSHCLGERSIDHVVLERDEVASAWRGRRRDSLRLLTPNWLSRLPGWHYRGDDPDGYMTAPDMADHLEGYRRSFGAPVHTRTEVLAVTPTESGYVVDTTEGRWSSRALVVATGAAGTPRVPALARALPRGLTQLTADEYRRPAQVGDGPVLVVGASASGVQIADELRRAGRRVSLAVGEHLRLPRRYRGRDIHWWMDALGLLAQRWDAIRDLERARRLPSPQLVGSPEGRNVDLPALHAAGVELLGRLVGFDGQWFRFSDSLAQVSTAADLKLDRLLDRIDDFATAHGLDDVLPTVERQPPTPRIATATARDRAGVGTVIWATGYRTTYPWLDPSLLDRRGGIRHDGGVMSAPGAYCLGLTLGRRRSSTSVDGVGPDARDLSGHLEARLAGRSRAA